MSYSEELRKLDAEIAEMLGIAKKDEILIANDGFFFDYYGEVVTANDCYFLDKNNNAVSLPHYSTDPFACLELDGHIFKEHDLYIYVRRFPDGSFGVWYMPENEAPWGAPHGIGKTELEARARAALPALQREKVKKCGGNIGT